MDLEADKKKAALMLAGRAGLMFPYPAKPGQRFKKLTDTSTFKGTWYLWSDELCTWVLDKDQRDFNN